MPRIYYNKNYEPGELIDLGFDIVRDIYEPLEIIIVGPDGKQFEPIKRKRDYCQQEKSSRWRVAPRK